MVAYESLKTKEKSSWVIQTSRSGRLRELFIIITKYWLQFKRDFTKVVVSRAGRLPEW